MKHEGTTYSDHIFTYCPKGWGGVWNVKNIIFLEYNIDWQWLSTTTSSPMSTSASIGNATSGSGSTRPAENHADCKPDVPAPLPSHLDHSTVFALQFDHKLSDTTTVFVSERVSPSLRSGLSDWVFNSPNPSALPSTTAARIAHKKVSKQIRLASPIISVNWCFTPVMKVTLSPRPRLGSWTIPLKYNIFYLGSANNRHCPRCQHFAIFGEKSAFSEQARVGTSSQDWCLQVHSPRMEQPTQRR